MTSRSDLPRLSRYRVEALLECPVWEPGPGSPAANFGKAAHRALELWANDPAAEVAACIAAGVAETQGFPAERHDELVRMVTQYAGNREHPREGGWAVATEVEMERTADGIAVLSGIADRCDTLPDEGAVRIVDYKTGWSAVKEPESAPFQVLFYAGLASRLHLAAEWFRVEIHALQTGWVHSWDLGVEDVEEWWQGMAERLGDVLANPDKRPTGGPACGFCKKRWECGAAVTALAHAPTTDAEAEEVIRETVRLEAAADERKKALRAYMDKREATTIAGVRLGYELSKPAVRVLDKERALALGVAELSKPSPRWAMK